MPWGLAPMVIEVLESLPGLGGVTYARNRKIQNGADPFLFLFPRR